MTQQRVPVPVVVRMGPCGGSGGNARDVDMRGVDRVVKVSLRHGDTVDAMSVLYERSGREEWTDLWGGPGGRLSEICLLPDEYFIGVEGRCGEFEGSFVVRSLTFLSNLRAYGPYGTQEDQDGGSVPFALPAAGRGRILGFHARSGRHLDALGTYVKVEHLNHSTTPPLTETCCCTDDLPIDSQGPSEFS